MAGGKLNPDMETANDTEWLRASERASALSGLLTRSSPAAVEEVARDLKLSPTMVHRLLAHVASILPKAARGR
jgi:hypothetical protein